MSDDKELKSRGYPLICRVDDMIYVKKRVLDNAKEFNEDYYYYTVIDTINKESFRGDVKSLLSKKSIMTKYNLSDKKLSDFTYEVFGTRVYKEALLAANNDK